jgi:hypothetical protein
MSRLRFYLVFATGSAVVLTLLSALWVVSGMSNSIIDPIVLTFPFLSTWVVGAMCYPHIDFEDAPKIVGFLILGGLSFIQWFSVGLVIAYLFRLYRLRFHK